MPDAAGRLTEDDAIALASALRLVKRHLDRSEVAHHLVGQVVLIGDRAVADLRDATAQVSLGDFIDLVLRRVP